MNRKLFYGWIIALCCTLIIFINGGIFFTFSVFFKPVAADFDWSRSEIASNYTAMLVAYAPGAFFAGRLADRHGPRKIMLLAALLIGLGFIGCFRASNLFFMITSYAVIGLGLGATLALPTATIQRWFLRLRETMVGIIHAGNGVGGLVFAPFANYLIMLYGWRAAYLIIGILFGGVSAAAASFLVAGPQIMKLRPYGEDRQNPDPNSLSESISADRLTLSKAFKLGSFWGMTALYIMNFIPAFFITSHLVPYVTDRQISASVGAQGLGLMAAMSIIGRLVMSWVAGKIGWVRTLTICYFVASAAVVWLLFITRAGEFYLFVIVYGLSWGSTLALLGGAAGFFFGLSALSELLGFLLGLGVLVGAFIPWLGGLIFDMTSSYFISMALAAVLYSAAGILTLTLRPPHM